MRNLKEIARKAFEEEVIHARSYSDERDANGLYVQEGLQAAWRNFCRGYESASEVTGAQGDGNSSSLAEILKGIDVCETDSDDGWWPTSTGAEFGARKLRELERFLADQAQDAEPVGWIRPSIENGDGWKFTANKELVAAWYKGGKQITAVYTRPPAANQGVPEGWKLVPGHANAAMVKRGKQAHGEEFLFNQDPDTSIQSIWKAMIAVAPPQPMEDP